MTYESLPDLVTPFINNLGLSFFGLLILLLIWTLIWKALALWKAARRGEKIWFVIFLIINTAGILEIIYLIIKHESKNSQTINPIAPKDFSPPSNPNLP